MPEIPSRDDSVTIAGSNASGRTGVTETHPMPEIPSRDDCVTIAWNNADAPIGEVPMNVPSRNDGETIICACGGCGRQF